MNVLITGGAGSMGSRLADACIRHGDSVAMLGDLTDVRAVHAAVEHCDAVYHLAAESNVWGTRVLMEAAAARMKRVVFVADPRYAYTKAAAEVLARAYRDERGLPVIVARLAWLEGVRQRVRDLVGLMETA